jgi:hypothetical protein
MIAACLPIFTQNCDKPVRSISRETRQASRHWSADQTAFQHAHQIARQHPPLDRLHQFARQRGSDHAGLTLCPMITAPKRHQAMAVMTDQGGNRWHQGEGLNSAHAAPNRNQVISVAPKTPFFKKCIAACWFDTAICRIAPSTHCAFGNKLHMACHDHAGTKRFGENKNKIIAGT